jgi:hypothetical protein
MIVSAQMCGLSTSISILTMMATIASLVVGAAIGVALGIHVITEKEFSSANI